MRSLRDRLASQEEAVKFYAGSLFDEIGSTRYQNHGQMGVTSTVLIRTAEIITLLHGGDDGIVSLTSASEWRKTRQRHRSFDVRPLHDARSLRLQVDEGCGLN